MAISASEVQKKEFNPNEHLMQIESGEGKKDYLPVQWRLVWFRSACPRGTIKTEMLHLDLEVEFTEMKKIWNPAKGKKEWMPVTEKGIAIFRAIVEDGQGGIATGTKSEKGVSFADFIEKAETGAIGRALAALGYGTQFTGDEWDEAHRIVDNPVGNDAKQHDQQAEPKQQSPKQLNPPDASIKAANDGLQKAGSLAKQRAVMSGLNWEQILIDSKITVFESGKDIAAVNRIIDALISEQAAS